MFAVTFLLCLVGGALIRVICVLADFGYPSVSLSCDPRVEWKEKQEIGMAEFLFVWYDKQLQ